VKAKRAKPTRVYPAESDPRHVNGKALRDFVDSGAWRPEWPPKPAPPLILSPRSAEIMKNLAMDERHAIEHAEFMRANTTEALAREFGPWVKAADGSWFRDRSKRRRKR